MKQLTKIAKLFALFILVSDYAYSYDFEVDGIYYRFNIYTQSATVTSGDIKYKGNVVIPSSISYGGRELIVTEIDSYAFSECLELTDIVLPSTITTINGSAFYRCEELKKLTIPHSVKKINDWYAFSFLSKLETLIVEDDINILLTEYSLFDFTTPKNLYLGRSWWFGSHSNLMEGIEILTIGKYVKEIYNMIDTKNLKTIYSMVETPEEATINFSSTAYVNATLYVPIGCKEKYMAADGWKNFFNIQEMDVKDMWNGQGEPNTESQDKEKCEKPTIRYSNGKLLFESTTEGAICQSTITDSDITSYIGNEVQLGVTYNISVYATAEGYDNSDVATATLCWIDVDPKTEGIENSVSQVRARAILLQTNNGTLNISGAEDGINIDIYTSSGMMVGSVKSSGKSTSIATGLRNGEVAIVKIGEKVVKVLMK